MISYKLLNAFRLIEANRDAMACKNEPHIMQIEYVWWTENFKCKIFTCGRLDRVTMS